MSLNGAWFQTFEHVISVPFKCANQTQLVPLRRGVSRVTLRGHGHQRRGGGRQARTEPHARLQQARVRRPRPHPQRHGIGGGTGEMETTGRGNRGLIA